VTSFTSFVAAYLNVSLFAKEGLFELEREILAEIGATLHPAAAATAASEHIAKAEELAEDVAEVLKYGGIDASGGWSSAKSCVPVAVIDGAFFRIGEHGVSFAHLFELFFCIGIVGIPVRMVLQSKLSICALQLNFCAGASNPKHLVVVAFCIRCQNMPFINSADPKA
jgi:hypothetical protein